MSQVQRPAQSLMRKNHKTCHDLFIIIITIVVIIIIIFFFQTEVVFEQRFRNSVFSTQ